MADNAEHQRAYWNSIADYYDYKYGYGTEKGYLKLCRKTLLVSNITRLGFGDKVLELGCGTGSSSNLLALQGLEVAGVDISEKMLGMARLKNKNVNYYKADIKRLPFLDISFDVILGFYILQYVDVSDVLQEVYRVLKPQGRVCFIEPNCLNPIVFAKTKIDLVKKIRHISKEANSFIDCKLGKLFSEKFNQVEVHYIEYGSLSFFSKMPLLKRVSGSLVVNGVKY